jgi:hypothetical protein
MLQSASSHCQPFDTLAPIRPVAALAIGGTIGRFSCRARFPALIPLDWKFRQSNLIPKNSRTTRDPRGTKSFGHPQSGPQRLCPSNGAPR